MGKKQDSSSSATCPHFLPVVQKSLRLLKKTRQVLMKMTKKERPQTTRSKIHTIKKFGQPYVTWEQVLAAGDAARALAHNRVCSGQSVSDAVPASLCQREHSKPKSRAAPANAPSDEGKRVPSHTKLHLCRTGAGEERTRSPVTTNFTFPMCIQTCFHFFSYLWSLREQMLTFCGERTPRIFLCRLMKSRCIRCSARSLLFTFKVFLSLSRLH